MSVVADMRRRAAERKAFLAIGSESTSQPIPAMDTSLAQGLKSPLLVQGETSAETEVGKELAVISSDSVPKSDKKRKSGDADSALNTYRPSWAVMESDSFGGPASKLAKELSQDLCGSFILPADRPIYDAVSTVEACENMLGHLSLVSSFSTLIFFPLFILWTNV